MKCHCTDDRRPRRMGAIYDRTRRVMAGALIAMGIIGERAMAQQVARVMMDAPELEYAQPFRELRDIRELRDGRVFVRAQELALVDLVHGKKTLVDAQGLAVTDLLGERFLSLPEDTTLFINSFLRTILRLDPTGPTIRTINDFILPQGFYRHAEADRDGRIYGLAPDAAGDRGLEDGDVGRDSVLLLRWDRKQGHVDTLAWIKEAPFKATDTDGYVVANAQTFGARDIWSVAEDGRVGIIRSDKYHIEWINGTKSVVGPVVMFTPVKVSEAEKDSVRNLEKIARDSADELAKGAQGVSSGDNPLSQMLQGGGALQSLAAQILRSNHPPPSFPEYHPPFIDGRISPDGLFWVQRDAPGSSTGPLYDLFGADGHVVRQVELPKGTQLLGFGRESVYLVRKDKDGLEWLGRYRRP